MAEYKAEGIEPDALKRRFGVDLTKRNSALIERSETDGLLRHEGVQ